MRAGFRVSWLEPGPPGRHLRAGGQRPSGSAPRAAAQGRRALSVPGPRLHPPQKKQNQRNTPPPPPPSRVRRSRTRSCRASSTTTQWRGTTACAAGRCDPGGGVAAVGALGSRVATERAIAPGRRLGTRRPSPTPLGRRRWCVLCEPARRRGVTSPTGCVCERLAPAAAPAAHLSPPRPHFRSPLPCPLACSSPLEALTLRWAM